MRVLGRIRLSRMMEESTSVERQREFIETWARQNDHEIVGWAEDLDVSGSVDPFDTQGLGPWLKEPKLREWDILCAWKLDRLARRAVPLHKLFGMCQDEQKVLVCVSDNIDLSTWVGRLVASVIAGVAEGELEAIRERTLSSQRKLRELGRWAGGKPAYGFKAQEREGSAGYELVHDEHAANVMLGVIEKVLAGQSTESVARELNEAGELAPSDYIRARAGRKTRGTKWSNAQIRQLLKSKTLLGHVTHNGSTVRDDDGIPIRKGPALISEEKFDQLQAALDARSFKVTNRSAKASPLLGVAICGLCGRPMHIRQHRRNGNLYRYYRCDSGSHSGGGGAAPEHPSNIIKADDLEALVEEHFLDEVGGFNVQEKVYVPASDHRAELDEAVRAVEELTQLLGTMTSATMKSRLMGQLTALDERIARLENLPSEGARWDYRATDQTYAEAWEEADTEGRRQLLIRSGITAEVKVTGGDRGVRGVLEFHLKVPEDVRERLSA
ncbi:serine integrase [Mycobacterium phage Cuco]|uniref:Serine integrase n=1 Tax=Mycobacterium phage Cuco TaxID=2922992 RepID=G1JUK5_9CAUD|nr:integrase [Mycobacterium phage Cuco]AEL17730.1 serine integrase [Mycobacterium phage Cuco]